MLDQVLPFHDSTRVCGGSSRYPTAVHELAETHDTPWSTPETEADAQVVPFHDAMAPPPTALQKVIAMHETE